MILGILNTLAAAGLAYLVFVGANIPDPEPVFEPIPVSAP
jgi:hypothetical protein